MQRKEAGLALSTLPVIVLILLLVINYQCFGDGATGGPNQLALLIAGMFTLALGSLYLKVPYKEMEDQVVLSISLATQACLILLVVGALIGVWILSGIVPTMIYYGLKIINPAYFLPVACVSCSLVALSTGSSWSTSSTVGIALIGIGHTLGVNPAMTAGAVISGSYFGDKMSPLSDTTNLAPAMAGTDLITHIRHMMYTSGPAIILSVIGFFILGLSVQGSAVEETTIQATLGLMEKNFNIGLHLFIVPLMVLVMVAKKVPALPALVIGTLLGALTAVFFQAELLEKLTGGATFSSQYIQITKIAYGGFVSETGNALVDKLFSRGGMYNMLSTVWLILMAMVFGGAMEATGMLEKLAGSILQFVSGAGSLIGSVVGTCLFLNMTASDQYLAIVVTGRMYRSAFEKFGLHPKNLSRALEDSGTVTSVLVPWNSGGAFHSKILDVKTLDYLPFCFFNILSPLISVFLASMGWTIEKLVIEKEEQAA